MNSPLPASALPHTDSLFRSLLLSGLSLLSFLSLLFILATAGLWLNIPLSPYHVLLAGVLSVLLLVLLFGRQAWSACLMGLLLILAALIFSSNVIDVSWDGQTYHAEAVYQLMHGWNPYWSPTLYNNAPALTPSPWVLHYPKALWLIRACFYKLTGSYSSMLAPNLLISLAMSLFCSGAFYRVTRKAGLALLFGLLLWLNPVILPQLFSNYMDGFLGAALCILIMALFAGLLQPAQIMPDHENALAGAFSILLIVNLKFTGLVYVVLFVGVFLVAKLIQVRTIKQIKGLVLRLGFCLGFSTLVFGYNPYIPNWLNHGHPFYPLSGKDALDIMTPNTPDSMLGKNSLEKAFDAYFGIPMSYAAPVHFYWDSSPEAIKTQLQEYFTKSFYSDVRVGGWGLATPFLVFFLLVSSPLITLCLKENRLHLPYLSLAGAVLLSVVINPEFWWARYTPQLWFLVTLNCILPLSLRKLRTWRLALSGLCLLVFLTNSSLILCGALKYNSLNTQSARLAYQTAWLESKTGPLQVDFNTWYAVKILFDEYNVRYQEINFPNDAGFIFFPLTQAKIKK